MPNDPQVEYLLDRCHGLQGVIVALLAMLIEKDVIEKETLMLHLGCWQQVLAQNEDQAEAFESVIRTLEDKGWIPRVYQGGKLDSPDPEADSDD